MLIILEGADGVGKTTVAAGLMNLLGDARLLHASQPKADWVTEYVTPLVDYQPNNGHGVPGSPSHIVCDRWHWGEVIYGPLYRNASILDEDGMLYMNAFLNSKGAVIVHMWNTEDTLLQRWSERGEDFLQPEHLAGVLNRYHDLARHSFVPVINFRDVGPSEVHSILTVAGVFEHAAADTYGGAS